MRDYNTRSRERREGRIGERKDATKIQEKDDGRNEQRRDREGRQNKEENITKHCVGVSACDARIEFYGATQSVMHAASPVTEGTNVCVI